MTTPTPAADLDINGLHVDLSDVIDNRLFDAMRPYRNGVTVYRRSVWEGNGFGTSVTRVAVRDGVIVGVYESSGTHRAARVVGETGNLYADFEWVGHGANRRRYTTRTALQKWTDSVKTL